MFVLVTLIIHIHSGAADISSSSAYSGDVYNDALENCIQNNSIDMPFYDAKTDEYWCHTLLEQGPCLDDEWFVANKSAINPLAECQKQKCPDNEIPFEKKCYENNSTVCGESQILLLNPFGEGNVLCTMHIFFFKSFHTVKLENLLF